MINRNNKLNNKLQQKRMRLPILFVVISLFMFVGATLAFQFFEAKQRAEFSTANVELQSTINFTKDLSEVVSGDVIVTNSSFSKTADSKPCYVRANLEFGSTATNLTRQEQNYILSLNAVDYSSNIATGVNGAKWLNTHDNYYYLVDNSNNLIEVNNTTVYNFGSNIKYPSIDDLYEFGLQIDSSVEEIYLDLNFQAIGLNEVHNNDFNEIKETFDFAFNTDLNREFIVTFDTGEIDLNIPAQLVRNGGRAQDVQVESSDYYVFNDWYSDSECTIEFDFNSLITGNTRIYGGFEDGYIITFMKPDNITIAGKVLVPFDNVTTQPNLTTFTSDEGTTIAYVDGWYADTALQNEFEFGNVLSSDITLYPKAILVSSGLSYSLLNGSTAYSVSKGSCSDTCVVIPELYKNKPVTVISSNAFKDYTSLTNIYLPSSIRSIYDYAFDGCTNLELTSLPDKIVSINMNAFSDCTKLALTSLPSGLTCIDHASFSGCTSLALTSIPSGVTYIDNYAFQNCTGLKQLSLPNGITRIGRSAFYGCTNLELAALPSALVDLTYDVFVNCKKLALTSLPSGLRNIEDNVFSGCTSLALTSLPNNLTRIANRTFYNCSNLALSALPKSIASIGTEAFYGCTNFLSNDTVYYLPISGTSNNAIIRAKNTSITTINWPANVTVIAGGAFENCYSLAITSLPSGIKSVGVYAFINCNIPSNDTVSYLPILGTANNVVLRAENTNITTVNWPANVTIIADGAFDRCTSLALTSLPSTLTTVGADAFYYCRNLALTSLPSGITYIGSEAFYSCENMTLTSLPSGLTMIEDGAFRACTNLALTSLPSGITYIGNAAFYECPNLALTSLPNGVTTLGSWAFNYCSNITLTSLPSSLINIGVGVFNGCTNLALTSLPSGITSLGENAFSSSKVVITSLPSGVISIGDYAFHYCQQINILNLGPNIVAIDKLAFNGCSDLEYLLCESESVANIARGKGISDNRIYARQANGYASGTSETTVVVNGITIYTATVNGYNWVRNGSKYYKAIA